MSDQHETDLENADNLSGAFVIPRSSNPVTTIGILMIVGVVSAICVAYFASKRPPVPQPIVITHQPTEQASSPSLEAVIAKYQKLLEEGRIHSTLWEPYLKTGEKDTEILQLQDGSTCVVWPNSLVLLKTVTRCTSPQTKAVEVFAKGRVTFILRHSDPDDPLIIHPHQLSSCSIHAASVLGQCQAIFTLEERATDEQPVCPVTLSCLAGKIQVQESGPHSEPFTLGPNLSTVIDLSQAQPYAQKRQSAEELSTEKGKLKEILAKNGMDLQIPDVP